MAKERIKYIKPSNFMLSNYLSSSLYVNLTTWRCAIFTSALTVIKCCDQS